MALCVGLLLRLRWRHRRRPLPRPEGEEGRALPTRPPPRGAPRPLLRVHARLLSRGPQQQLYHRWRHYKGSFTFDICQQLGFLYPFPPCHSPTRTVTQHFSTIICLQGSLLRMSYEYGLLKQCCQCDHKWDFNGRGQQSKW